MRTLDALFIRACEHFPRKNYVTFPHDSRPTHVRYHQALALVNARAACLRYSYGIDVGSRVALIGPKSPEQIWLILACWRIGAVAVPVSETLGDLEMGFVIRDSTPSLIIADNTVNDVVRRNAGDVPIIGYEEMTWSSSALSEASLTAEIGEDSLAAVIYTSGSTGMPKGVMLTHKNLFVNAASALEVVRIGSGDAIMSLLPYWHSFALLVEVVAASMAGARVIVAKDKRDFRQNLRLYRPTIILLVPRIVETLFAGVRKRLKGAGGKRTIADKAIENASKLFRGEDGAKGGLICTVLHRVVYDPLVFREVRKVFGGRLRFFISGGAPLNLEHEHFFRCIGLPVYQGYGLTETSPVVSTNHPDVHRLGSCGKLLPWLRQVNGGGVAFLCNDGTLRNDGPGELLVKGDCVMKGYWRHRDESAKTLSGGWLHTGDVGHLDVDGFLYIEGRNSNMLALSGGEKVHPEYVEGVLRSCPFVAEAMLIGDGCKNVYACINVNTEAAKGHTGKRLLAEIRKQVQAQTEGLAPYQRPRDILILPDFTTEDGTLTPTLKVRRYRVWEKYGDRIVSFLRDNGVEIGTAKGH
ncbi:MAG: AMP-binding protein [Candidatus Pacebacteria bacterium]|nr:AMP-binding protein [Candidatus Paceibacterota bacterium]